MNTLSNLLSNNFLGMFLSGLLKPQEYLDPGTGSFFIQIIISSIVGLLYLFRVYLGKITAVFWKKILRDKLSLMPLHTILGAAFFVVSLIGNNLLEMNPGDGVRALYVSMMFAILSWGAFSLILRNAEKGAIIATVGIILFFSYGHIHESFLFPLTIFGAPLHSHRYLATIFLILFLSISWLLLKYVKNISETTRVLNIMTVVALLLPIYQIGTHMIRQAINNEGEAKTVVSVDLSENSMDQRDIYLFVLDMYPRQDFLLEEIGIDNSGFIQDLEDIGFYVAQCSQSNYQHTRTSLSTMFSMIYFEEMVEDLEIVDGPHNLRPLVLHGEVRAIFEQMGYDTLAFATEFGWSEWVDADIFYSVDWDETDMFMEQMIEDQALQSPISGMLVKAGVNDFEWLLLKTTAFSLVLDNRRVSDTQPNDSEFYSLGEKLRRFRLTRFVFDSLMNDVPTKPGPKFVFIHLIMPHPPFVFTAEGEFLAEELPETEAIAASISYLDDQLLLIVEKIIDQSKIEPIIILMGDHGYPPPSSAKRSTEILNAYYLPDSDVNLLYSDISPVNTFRLILTEYFGAEYPLLDDKSFYNPEGDPFAFYEVENLRSNCDEIPE